MNAISSRFIVHGCEGEHGDGADKGNANDYDDDHDGDGDEDGEWWWRALEAVPAATSKRGEHVDGE